VLRDPFNPLAPATYILEMDRDVVAAEPAKGSERVVEQWRAFALPARPRGGRARWLATQELELLLALGIVSGEELRARGTDLPARDRLEDDLRKEANRSGRRGPTDPELKDLISWVRRTRLVALDPPPISGGGAAGRGGVSARCSVPPG
jgi:hypothetical protein